MESRGNDESKVCGVQKKCELEKESLWTLIYMQMTKKIPTFIIFPFLLTFLHQPNGPRGNNFNFIGFGEIFLAFVVWV